MHVFLSSPTFDLNGTARLTPAPASDFGEVRRRVNRVQTLDGGVAVNDGGACDGDRTLSLQWRPGALGYEQGIEHLVATYPRLYAATRDGFYAVVPESYRRATSESKLVLLVVERLA